MVKWLIEVFNEPTYRPQGVSDLLFAMDDAIVSGHGTGKLLAAKLLLLALRGSIDLLTWQWTMEVFGLGSNTPRTGVSAIGPRMPPNVEFIKLIEDNPNLFENRVPEDVELLNSGYGLKLSYTQCDVSKKVLKDYVFNIQTAHRLNFNVSYETDEDRAEGKNLAFGQKR
uniref:Uncharacterized protein n=1 Tax=Panagrolaimus superbus TaxID=310955 RepID=A0A914Y8Z6_9BILA